jgi:hypothetical protein
MSVTSTPPPAKTEPSRPKVRRTASLVGTRLAMVGVVAYLLEFVGIGFAGVAHLPSHPGTSAHDVASAYAGHLDGLAFLIGWYGVFELGRVLFAASIATALQRSGRPALLGWFATAAMATGVVMEIAMQALATGAGELAASGNDAGAYVLDRGAWFLEAAIMAPSGLAVICLGVAMVASGVFPRPLGVLGVPLGGCMVASGMLSAPAQFDFADTLSTAVLLVWLWMIATGVVLWRHAPQRVRHAA